ncbi:MAG: glycosyltransferase family 39 protein [Candidatus Hodarchaeales archaeon]
MDSNDLATTEAGIKQSLVEFFASYWFVLALVFFVTGILELMGPNAVTRFMLTRSMAVNGLFSWDWSQHDFWFNPDFAIIDDRYYCDKAPGMSFLGYPVYLVIITMARFSGLSFTGMETELIWLDDLVIYTLKFILAVASAWGVRRFRDILVELDIDRKTSNITAGILAFCTLFWVYSILYMPHALITVMYIIIMYRGIRYKKHGKLQDLVIAAAISGYAIVIEFLSVIVIPWFFIYFFFTHFQDKGSSDTPGNESDFFQVLVTSALKMVVFILFVVIFSLPLFIYNSLVTGDIFTPVYNLSHWSDNIHFFNDTGAGLTTLLFSADRGLFIFNPVLVFGLIGLFWLAKQHLEEAVLALFIASAIILFYSRNFDPSGGISFGPRYIIPAIPFLAAGTGSFIQNSKKKWYLNVPLVLSCVYGFILSFAGTSAAFLMMFGTRMPDPFSVIEEYVKWFFMRGIRRYSIITKYSGFTFIFMAVFAVYLLLLHYRNRRSREKSSSGNRRREIVDIKNPQGENSVTSKHALIIYTGAFLGFLYLFFNFLVFMMSSGYTREIPPNLFSSFPVISLVPFFYYPMSTVDILIIFTALLSFFLACISNHGDFKAFLGRLKRNAVS